MEKPKTRVLGTTLDAGALKAQLADGTILWANLPPSQELFARLALRETNSLVSEADNIDGADYILAGNLTEDGAEWARLHKPEYMAGPRAAVTKDHSPGCSTQSNYPLASDWVLIADADSVADGSVVLNKYSALLGKVNGWLNLSSNLSGASPADYYRLEFKRVGSNATLEPGEAARQDDRLQMFLKSSTWVSVDRVVSRSRGLVAVKNSHKNLLTTDSLSRYFVADTRFEEFQISAAISFPWPSGLLDAHASDCATSNKGAGAERAGCRSST